MKRLFVLLVALTSLTLGGCASQVYKSDAFKKRGNFAVVQISGQTSGFGLGTKEDKKLLNVLSDIIYKEYKSNKHFKLVSPRKVKKSRAYGSLKTDTSEGLLTLKTANGYKKFDPRDHSKEIKNLFKELKVDAILSISAGYNKAQGGVTLSGILPFALPVSAGTTHGEIMYSVVATDINNQVIWQDVIKKETEDGVGHFMGVSNFNKLYPQLLDISKFAVAESLHNLDKNLKTQ